MPKPLPKNLGGLGSHFWKQVKQRHKLKKDEDLEKLLIKLETELAALGNSPTSAEVESIKKHLLKAKVSAANVMKNSKEKQVTAFCDAINVQFERYIDTTISAIGGAAARERAAEGNLISADVFSLAGSKFPNNKALKAFIKDKAFTLFSLEGRKPVRDPELARLQAVIKTQQAQLVKCYEALGKLSKVKKAPPDMVGKIKAVYEKIGDALDPMDGIGANVAEWWHRMQDLYAGENASDQYETKFKKKPVFAIARLLNSAANDESNAYLMNRRLLDTL